MYNQHMTFLLGIIALAMMFFVIVRHRTVLFGFTIFGFFTIARVSLLAFLHNYLFGLDDYWISSPHIEVFTYTAWGLIAFMAGVAIAWRPLRRLPNSPALPSEQVLTSSLRTQANRHLKEPQNQNFPPYLQNQPWLNPRFAVLCVGLGGLAILLQPVAFAIPTLRTIWTTYIELLEFGMLIALLYSFASSNFRPLFIGICIFIPMVLYRAVLTGHITAGGFFLIQLLLLGCFWRGLSIRSVVIFGFGMLLVSSFLIGWLNSRDTIRSGSLDALSPFARVNAFVRDFDYVNPASLNPANILEAIRKRGDASDILAAQVVYQPDFVPYEYGRTIIEDLQIVFIPRFLWPDKPAIAGGSEFVTRYSGLHFDEDTSVGLPYQFELYANGGTLWVIIGLFIIGWLLARLELALFQANLSLPMFLMLLFITGALANGAQNLVLLLMIIVIGSVSYFVLGKVLWKWNGQLQVWNDNPVAKEYALPRTNFTQPRFAPGKKYIRRMR